MMASNSSFLPSPACGRRGRAAPDEGHFRGFFLALTPIPFPQAGEGLNLERS